MDENDWEELELAHDEEDELGLRAEATNVLPWLVWALLAVSLLLGLGYYLTREREPASDASAPAAAPAPSAELETEAAPEAPPPPEEPDVELPPLSASDAFVRDLAAGLSAQPELASVLVPDDIVRRFVVVVVNVADGESPRRQLRHLRPEADFAAARRGGQWYLDPEGYGRYDRVADVYASLDAEGAAKLVRLLEPLEEEAFAELGLGPTRSFRETLARAIAHLLATPAVDGPIALRAESVNYTFADERLEGLSAAQKHLLRMGPSSTRRVQAKLEEIAAALGLALPAES
jgi:hypothetical protein